MTTPQLMNRRTVLKTLGVATAGSAVLTGTAAAGETGDNRRQQSFTWAEGTLYEMLESEPHPLDQDNEGNEEAHRPIWLVASQGDYHSPHFPPAQADHVIDLEPGTRFFSAQWHVHAVLNDSNPANATGLAETGVGGAPLKSDEAIMDAVEAEEVSIVPEHVVFTCPVRPHQHK